jgi:hypothetical protein
MATPNYVAKFNNGGTVDTVAPIFDSGTGNVGIGTTTPQGLLQLKNSYVVAAAPTGNAATDTANINNAIAAVTSNGYAGTVCLQAGRYVINAAIFLPSGLKLIGAGAGMSFGDYSKPIFDPQANSGKTIIQGDTSIVTGHALLDTHAQTYVVIKDLCLDSTQASPTNIGINFQNSHFCVAENVAINNMATGIYVSYDFNQLRNFFIINCNTGILLGDSAVSEEWCSATLITGGQIIFCNNYGIRVSNGHNNWLYGITLESNWGAGAVAAVAFDSIGSNVLNGCYLEGNDGPQVKINSPCNKILGNFINCWNNVIGQPAKVSGLHDLTTHGVYTGTYTRAYVVQITNTGGGVDKFKWSSQWGAAGSFNATDIPVNTNGTPGSGCTINITGTTNGVITTAEVNLSGSGYQVNEALTIAGGSGSGGKLRVSSVGGGGAVTGLAIIDGGSGYGTATNLSTSCSYPPIYLSNGVYVTFNNLQGHSTDDYWVFNAFRGNTTGIDWGSGANLDSGNVLQGTLVMVNPTSARSDDVLLKNLGIGTTTPGAQLDVSKANIDDLIGFKVSRPGSGYLGINSASSAGAWSGLAQNNDKVILFTNASKDTGALVIGPWSNSPKGIRMDSDGNVGIGTASPGSIDGQQLKLNVSGYAGFNGLRVGLDGSNDILADSANGLTIASKNAGAKMRFKTGGTGNVRMTIDSAGNVGIGETSPTAKLDIVHSGSGTRGIEVNCGADATDGVVIIRNGIAATNFALLINNAGDKMRVDFNGNGYFAGAVGIGVAGPGAKLEIQDAVGANGIIVSATADGNSPFITWKDNGATAADKYSMRYDGSTSKRFQIGYGDSSGFTEQVSILQAGGNVGIGETSPARKLHVKDSNKQVARIESTAVSNLKVDVCVNNGTPNAVITALRGSLCVDITNAKLYINNSGTNPGDSGTSWVLV